MSTNHQSQLQTETASCTHYNSSPWLFGRTQQSRHRLYLIQSILFNKWKVEKMWNNNITVDGAIKAWYLAFKKITTEKIWKPGTTNRNPRTACSMIHVWILWSNISHTIGDTQIWQTCKCWTWLRITLTSSSVLSLGSFSRQSLTVSGTFTDCGQYTTNSSLILQWAVN